MTIFGIHIHSWKPVYIKCENNNHIFMSEYEFCEECVSFRENLERVSIVDTEKAYKLAKGLKKVNNKWFFKG